jgi:circadian clock protein KaiC
MSLETSSPPRAATGIPGLDHILGGGWPRNRLFLVEGDPGTGKTTLALQFLLEGTRQGEPGLYITLSETAEELRAVAASHGWSLDGLALHELAVPEDSLDPDAQYTLFHPSEVELGETTKLVLAEVERVQPQRVVFDSLSEMRLLARDPLRYRRQILALKQFFVGRQCTVLLLDDRTSGGGDKQLHSLVHGVAALEQQTPVYGPGRRRLRVSKLRGVRFQDGYHDFSIVRGGLVICPRLVAAEHRAPFVREAVSGGVPDLDALLGGGLDRGTSTLVLGAAGVGKSSLALQFALAAAGRDERAALYTFDEGAGTLFARAAGLGLDLRAQADAGRVHVRQIDPAEMSPGEFAHLVRKAVEDRQVRLVVLDSLNGYLNAMPEDRFLAAHLHELLTYLGQRGVVTLLIVAQHGLVGSGMETPVDVSYLADTVILLRYFEAAGAVRQAISVLKKRSGGHERTIREFRLGPRGVQVGAPLKEFHGVLTGVPTYLGPTPPLLGDGDADA